jgi:hypothetical protein
MDGIMTTEETLVRAAAQSAGGFTASADPSSGIVVLARGRGRAATLVGALPAAIESAVFESVPAEPGSEAASWPAPVRSVIAFLGAVHHDLRGESTPAGARSTHGPSTLDVLVAIPAGDRVHVVAAGAVAGFRAQEGRWERLAPLGDRARRPLGLDPKARIEITSEPYRTGDLFLAIPDDAPAGELALAVAPPFAIGLAIAGWAVAADAPEPTAEEAGAYAVLAWQPAAEPIADLAPEEISALPELPLADDFDGHLVLRDDPEIPATPAAPAMASGELPAWLLERAAKDLGGPSRTGGDVEPASEPAPRTGGLAFAYDEEPFARESTKRSRRPLAIGIGIGALILVVGGAGFGLRDQWPALQARLAAATKSVPNAGDPAQASAGNPAADMAQLLTGTRPWQRVVTGAVPGETASQPEAVAAASDDAAAAGSGSIEARTEPFLPDIMVYVDGKPVGKAPQSLDGLNAGTHLVAFDGGNGRRWEEEVTVMPNEVAVAVAPLGANETEGMVEVLASAMHDDGPDDQEVKVLVDGEVRGATPLDLTLDPGTHGIALDLGNGRVIYRVVDVRSGDKQVLDVPVDSPPPFVIEHRPAASLTAGGTVILTVDVKGPAGAATYLNLHVETNGVFKAVPMGPVAGAPGTYAVGLPVTREQNGKQLRYYFTTAADGEEPVVTRIFEVPLR